MQQLMAEATASQAALLESQRAAQTAQAELEELRHAVEVKEKAEAEEARQRVEVKAAAATKAAGDQVLILGV